jgi:hypothetical protein
VWAVTRRVGGVAGSRGRRDTTRRRDSGVRRIHTVASLGASRGRASASIAAAGVRCETRIVS